MRFGSLALEAAIATLYINSGEFTGSRMVFAQGTAPQGWTKDSTYNDYALRVTNGTTSSGGSINFSSVMTTQSLTGTATMSGTSLGATTLSSMNIPNHYHSGTTNGAAFISNTPSPSLKSYYWSPLVNTMNTFASPATSTAWLGGSHTHSVSPAQGTAGVSFDMSVKYLDVIIATKN